MKNSHNPSNEPKKPQNISPRTKFPKFQSETSPNYADPIHNLDGLELRTIVLLDGTAHHYYALPHHYPVGPTIDEASLKRKRGVDGERLRENVRKYGNPNFGNEGYEEDGLRLQREIVRRYGDTDDDGSRVESGVEKVDNGVDEEAFLRCVKMVNESLVERNMYLEDGKNKPLKCIVCKRSSNIFNSVHDLIVHAYTSKIDELRGDHLGLHKAICILMGWDYSKPADISKAYQSLPIDEAATNREDLIVWPPTVIIHNTNTGRRKDGRMGGLSDKEVEMKLEELGFTGGVSKSLYGKGGHLGIAAVKFASNLSGYKEAKRLAEHFEKEEHGRKMLTLLEASNVSEDESSGKPNNLYGYLATATDLEKVDVDTRKRAVIRSKRKIDSGD